MKSKMVKRTWKDKYGIIKTKYYEYDPSKYRQKYKGKVVVTKSGKLAKNYEKRIEEIVSSYDEVNRNNVKKTIKQLLEFRIQEGKKLTTSGLKSLLISATTPATDYTKFEIFLTNAGLTKDDLVVMYGLDYSDIESASFNGDGTVTVGDRTFELTFNYQGNVLEEV